MVSKNTETNKKRSSKTKAAPKSAKKKVAIKVGTKTKKSPAAKQIKKTISPTTDKPVATAKNNTEKNFFNLFSWQSFLNGALAHSKTTALLLGVLLTAALPPFYYICALFVAFAGAMLLALNTDKLKSLAAIGYWFGFGYFAAGFYWIGNALLIDIARTGILYPLVLLLNGAFFGLFTILPFMITKIGNNILTKSMLFAAFWCLICEWLRSFILTGFPWNPISSVITFSLEMMQILAVCGTYGVSLCLVFFALLPAMWLNRPSSRNFYLSFGAILFFFVAAWTYGGHILEERPYVSDGESLVVRLVQPSIPQTLKWNRNMLENNVRTYVNLSKERENGYVDFTIWGETAYPFDLTDDYTNRKITPAVPPYGYLITGFLRRVDNGYRYTPYNSFGVINKQGKLVGWYDKSHLVPFGEYVPLRKYLPNWVKPLANTVAEFGRGKQYQTLKIADFPMFAPLICYEIIFSDKIVQKEPQKPTWAIVLTNDGWYGISAGPYQHLAAAQMRAVEEGITIVRSANSGISAVINPYGEIKAQISLGQTAAVDALVKPKESHSTFFAKYGNTIPLTMSLFTLVLALLCSLLSSKFRKSAVKNQQ